MKLFLLIPLGIASLFGGISVAMGTAIILRANGYLEWFLCFVTAMVVAGISLSLKLIWKQHRSTSALILKPLSILTIGFNFLTTFGVLINHISQSEVLNQFQIAVVVFLAALITLAPILFSFQLGNNRG